MIAHEWMDCSLPRLWTEFFQRGKKKYSIRNFTKLDFLWIFFLIYATYGTRPIVLLLRLGTVYKVLYTDGKLSVGASQHYDNRLVAPAIIWVFGDYAVYCLCCCTVNYELLLYPEMAEVYLQDRVTESEDGCNACLKCVG